jgi:hypothetical protein
MLPGSTSSGSSTCACWGRRSTSPSWRPVLAQRRVEQLLLRLPAKLLLAGCGDCVRQCGRHHFLVTCSWGWAERPSALARRTSGSRGSRGRTSRQGSSLRTLGRWMRMRFIAHLLGRSPEGACNAGKSAFKRLSRTGGSQLPGDRGAGSGASQRLGRSLQHLSTSPCRTWGDRLQPGDRRQRGGVPLRCHQDPPHPGTESSSLLSSNPGLST